MSQLEPSNTAYNRSHAYRFTGSLDLGALERSLSEIVRRHESLRTTFSVRQGHPIQVIAPATALRLSLIDLSALPADAREAEAARLSATYVHAPFDLAAGPLFRARLLRMGVNDHRLLLSMHHIVFDGWSVGVLRRELSALYAAFREGKPSGLPELRIQYADYAVWQRQWLQGERLDAEVAYWRSRLADAPTLEFPTDHPRPLRQTCAGARHSFALSPELTAKLNAFNRRESVTPFMSLLTAFYVLLSRYTWQDDILVGTPVANRWQVELEHLIGFFVNTLVLRGDLSGDPSFRGLLARVKQASLEAYQHQDLPFEKLVEELNPPRDSSRHPLFQVLFALQNAPRSPLKVPGMAASRHLVPADATPFDLELHFRAQRETWAGAFSYNTDLFDAATIERLAGHYQTLLEHLLTDPERPTSTLPMLSNAERQQLLVDWNATEAVYPRDKCIHELFEAQVERTPEAEAVVFESRRFTYRDLNGLSNQLAHSLRQLGVGPETLVGLAVERSPVMVVALLGILKAGAAYLPLDPAYPSERLTFMLEDAQAPLLLTQASLLDQLPKQDGVRVLCLDSDWERITAESPANPILNVAADNLAYVSYTSGSTGQPKGVAVPHRAVVRLLFGTGYARLDESQRILQASTISFDASTFEIWGALLHGACSVLFPGRVPSVWELRWVIAKQRVTTLWLTSALFNAIIDEAPDVLAGVRQLLVGGEALSADHVRRALERLRDTELINGYGPTESTTFTCCYPIPRALGAGVTSVPIGRPIANTRVYVLDRRLQPVPVGVPGELHIGGDGLARGYLKRPELTAEKFIPDPFSGEAGARLYKTGDRVRYLPDGNLEFLGRLDNQVKIRGFRIEPAEVEAVLNQHPAVRESVVMALEDVAQGKRLAAVVVIKPGESVSDVDLQRFLGQKLPAHMVPTAFAEVKSLPLTSQGKVDRHAMLSAPFVWNAPVRGTAFPEDPLQFLFIQVWEELLDVRPISITDNFFELGGHSLLAVRMVARIEQLCGRKLPLATLYAGATIEFLSHALVEQDENQPESPLVEVQAGASKKKFFFLHGDFNGGGFYCLNLARHLGVDQPFFAIHPHGMAGQHVPPTIEAMAGDHLRMVRAVQPEGPYLLGGHCNGALEAFEIARQLRAQGQRVDLLVLISPSPARFNPRAAEGPHLLESPDLEGLTPDFRRFTLTQLYTTACTNYLFRIYPGRVTLFQPSEIPVGTNDPSRGWKDFAEAVEIHVIPGGHLTSITTHVQDLAEELKTCLRRAQEQDDLNQVLRPEPTDQRGTAPAGLMRPTPTRRKTLQPLIVPASFEKGPLGRNDPCWCGSGKKYKNCHLRLDRQGE